MERCRGDSCSRILARMSLIPGPDKAIKASSTRVLQFWDELKASHPEVAEVLKPALFRLWRRAIRRRPELAVLREGPVLRESRPRSLGAGISHGQIDPIHHVEDRTSSIALRVEYAFLIPDVGAFLVGLIFDPNGHITSLTAKAGSASSTLAARDLVWITRPDVTDAYRSWPGSSRKSRHGFACLVRLDGAADHEIASDLQLEFSDVAGTIWHLAPRPVIRDASNPLDVIRDILTLVPPRDPGILDGHVGPAVSALWGQSDHRERVIDVGVVPVEPKVSMVVPIYGRYDFIEYQMALFADDPDMRWTELIYVIDDPRIAEEAVRLCQDIYPIFGVACRVIVSEQNNGFAKATNLGASIASGSLLLMLNSDVMPRQHGWLAKLVEAYKSLPSPGALGPRLLYPDGSLQHGGMEFVEEAWFPGVWLNDHPGKGLPTTKGSDALQRVPAITAACLMVTADLYQLVGGLDEGYPVGDFEDSDFCLKLRQLGHDSWVAPWIELFHLERQSQNLDGDLDWRQSLTLYNAWRHSRKWDEFIRQGKGDPIQTGNGALDA